MTVVSINKRCSSCGGNKWEYLKEFKIWRCRYCDAQMERQEQYDGLYTIKNVVRQVILDSASLRIEQADKNLSECQKISSHYKGTLIASLCCRMIALVNGIDIDGQDTNTLIGYIRRNYIQLIQDGNEIDEEEAALYDFLDSSDAWAVLAMVFDTLGDQQRREYLLSLVVPEQVFSKSTNKSFLRVCLKSNRLDVAKQIVSNKDNIDVEDAFQTVLMNCSDYEAKLQMISELIKLNELTVKESVISDYLISNDYVETKYAVIIEVLGKGCSINITVLLNELLSKLDTSKCAELIKLVLQKKLEDNDMNLLIDYAISNKDINCSLLVLNNIYESGQFVSLNMEHIQKSVFDFSKSKDARICILETLYKFNTTGRIWAMVTTNYLLQAEEAPDIRISILKSLSGKIEDISANDFEKYVLECKVDGDRKNEIIEILLKLPKMNKGFFRDLTSGYLNNGVDEYINKIRTFRCLLEHNLELVGSDLIAYVCQSMDGEDTKARMLQIALSYGTFLPHNSLNTYLEQCSERFSTEIFDVLYKLSSTISIEALGSYLLKNSDSPDVKVRIVKELVGLVDTKLGSNYKIIFLEKEINCTLAQAYVLKTKDDIEVSSKIIQYLADKDIKLASNIYVSGKERKFNKYIQENRNQLSVVTERLCDDRGLFARFF